MNKVKLYYNKILLKNFNENIEITQSVLYEQESEDSLDYSQWIKYKSYLKYGIKNNTLRILNNQIYWAHLGVNVGSEQGFNRPVLVVRTTKESPVCTIIPLTLERLSDGIPYHIDLENGKSTVLVEQIRTISKNRIYNYHYEKQKYATITDEDWRKINEQLENIYRLKPLYNKDIKNNSYIKCKK